MLVNSHKGSVGGKLRELLKVTTGNLWHKLGTLPDPQFYVAAVRSSSTQQFLY